jgi:predicted GH43/DUF377 family glycosyl hydrolase
MILFFLLILPLFAGIEEIFYESDQKIVIHTRKYDFPNFPQAFNPSLIDMGDTFLLTFRYCPDREHQSWMSYIGYVFLDHALNPMGEPQLLNTRAKNSKTPSQTEDARLFRIRDKIFLIYNDNIDEIFFDHYKRRDIFISQLDFNKDGKLQMLSPLKLIFQEKYATVTQQKNWVPFEWNQNLYLSYSIQPHLVLSPSLRTSSCYTAYKTESEIKWPYGHIRGGTPAILVDGEYLAFFHSSAKTKSPASYNWKLWHYFMGAYAFSAEPPFALTKITEKPIIGADFYTPSYLEKRVIFPGGFVDRGNFLYIAYGKDDHEIWIATLDKDQLKKALKPIKN